MSGRDSQLSHRVSVKDGHSSAEPIKISKFKSASRSKIPQNLENAPPSSLLSFPKDKQDPTFHHQKTGLYHRSLERKPSSGNSIRFSASLEDEKLPICKTSAECILQLAERLESLSIESPSSFDGTDSDASSSFSNDVSPNLSVTDQDIYRPSEFASPPRLRPPQRTSISPSSPESPTKKRDRFIPSRSAFGNATALLHVGLPPGELTSREKRYRRTDDFLDPFLNVSRQRSPSRAWEQRQSSAQYRRVHSLGTSTVLDPQSNISSVANRQVSLGSVWRVGGTGAMTSQDAYMPSGHSVSPSETNPAHVPTYRSKFLIKPSSSEEQKLYSKRLSLALDLDRADRIFCRAEKPVQSLLAHGALSQPSSFLSKQCNTYDLHGNCIKTVWQDCQWVNTGSFQTRIQKPVAKSDIPTVLEAPDMRDDFYSSVLAYCHFAKCIAVGLGSKVYLWTEKRGVIGMPAKTAPTSNPTSYVASLAFSSETMQRCILAVGHGNGSIVLWSPTDKMARAFEAHVQSAAVHVSFHPNAIQRPSNRDPLHITIQEMLLAGDSGGILTVMFVEWPTAAERDLADWSGGLFIYARIALHSQQICGISWSPGGVFFATGGNDNLCCLVETTKILHDPRLLKPQIVRMFRNAESTAADFVEILESSPTNISLVTTLVNHQWRLNAAVKAIAFCPWQRGLLAVGGGSNDRCIHFYHTLSGAALAMIDCAAQVTALIWSRTRRELAVTLGFPTPDHPYRIAVYNWPNCEQIVAIPWYNEMRALHAIPYPGSRTVWAKVRPEAGNRSRIVEEGCIVIASSDGTIKFHEIWSELSRRSGHAAGGVLAGSDILEGFHGIDKDGVEVIR